LEVEEGPYEDETPYFVDGADPFVVRFRVKALVVLPIEGAPPIKIPEIWERYSRTKLLSPNQGSWAYSARLVNSLVEQTSEDGTMIESFLQKCKSDNCVFPVPSNIAARPRVGLQVKTVDGTAEVAIPGPEEATSEEEAGTDLPRESIRIQGMLAEIGATFGYSAWIPRGDRVAVEQTLSKSARSVVARELPIRFDDATLRTIENIDVLWLKRSRIVRVFEVEHTTAIYSGLLRMADLCALQPNIADTLPLHIVAPLERREKVFSEILRPVFSLLEGGPLSRNCTYLSYDAVKSIIARHDLRHMKDTILDELTESADALWSY
jgi:hypothetical protein